MKHVKIADWPEVAAIIKASCDVYNTWDAAEKLNEPMLKLGLALADLQNMQIEGGDSDA